MRALSNPKHERFAQEVVNGASASEAYKRAGYRPNRGDASILRNRPTIIRRIADLQDFNQEVAGKLAATQEVARSRAIERVVERFALSKAWVLERLRENVERAMQARCLIRTAGKPANTAITAWSPTAPSNSSAKNSACSSARKSAASASTSNYWPLY
jgi:hypothetical protein